MTRAEPWRCPRWVAHRGAGKLAPENTLAAFRVGASHGYRAFECDVKLSADGVPFLLHDDTLQRTTPARGVAGKRSWSDLSRLDAGGWHSRGYAGEPIPSLEGIARYCLHNGFTLNIEIKPTAGAEAETGHSVAQHAARLWADEVEKPLLSSFRPDALAAAQQAEPALPRALLLDTLRSGWFAEAQALACVAVVFNHKLIDDRLLSRVHGAGMKALCYTVNDPADVERLWRAGIDGMITDAVDRFAPREAIHASPA